MQGFNTTSRGTRLYHVKMESLSQEPQKTKIKRSSVSRFKLFQRDSSTLLGFANTKHFETNGLVGKVMLTNLITSGVDSYALAFIPSAIGDSKWYNKAGCCQSITAAPWNKKTNDIYYYIPNIDGFSLKRKLSYIKELVEVFPERLEIVDIQSDQNLKNPITQESVKSILASNGEGFNVVPYKFVNAKKWVVVKAKVESAAQYLYFLQFLRPLYQKVCVIYNHKPHKGGCISYYQPRLYFKLNKMFPKLTRIQLLFLSFTISGHQTSGVFFPFYVFNLGYSKLNNLKIPISPSQINVSVIEGPYVHPKLYGEVTSEFRKIYDAYSLLTPDSKVLTDKLQKYEFKTVKYNGSTQESNNHYIGLMLKNLMFCESVENYREAIRIISLITDDVTLIENIN